MDVGFVTRYEPSCVVPDDPGEVVRGARPPTPEDLVRLREQMIARLAESAARRAPRPAPQGVEERVRLAMKGWRANRPGTETPQ
jgi:hypothetical protein